MSFSLARSTPGAPVLRTALAAVRRGLGVLAVALAATAPAAAQGVGEQGPSRAVAPNAGDTLRVVNRARTTFVTAAGADTALAEATVFLRQVPGVRIAPPRTVVAAPGERRVLAHVLENLGNGPDDFVLSASGPAGWSLALYLDRDGDGALGAADTPLSGPLPLAGGAQQALLLVVDVPADAPDAGEVPVDVTATSSIDPDVQGRVRDLIAVRRPQASLVLNKTVDRAEATVNDTLTYTISWNNQGDGGTPPAVLTDTLPAGVRLVPGSMRLNGAPVTDAADADSATATRLASGRDLLRVGLGPVAPAAAGILTFRAMVAADAEGEAANVARLAWGEGVGVSSPGATTRVARASLTLTKERVGEGTVRVGSEVTYRLSWTNASATVAVRDAILTDTLPAELQFVSATGQPQVENGRVIRWVLGTLAPGATGSVTLVARAVAASPGGAPVVNRATARGANAAAVSAAEIGFDVLDLTGNELEVTKVAAVLEASLGDAIPYAVTIRNRGMLPVSGIVVTDLLPRGVELIRDRVQGADSVRLDGRELRLYVNGPVLPSETRVLRYAVTVTSPGGQSALENRATATAEDGRVRSDTAKAWVRIRSDHAMQTRALLGKVFVDVDGDGRQDETEPGLAGVDVWTTDGEVVTTDEEGRFSFPNIRPGAHAVRLDTLGMGGRFVLPRRGADVVMVRVDGWTTPRVTFAVVPRPGTTFVPAAAQGAPATGTAPTDAAPATPAAGAPASAAPAAPAAPVRADTALSPRVAALRTAEDRKTEEDGAFAGGPVVRVFSPADGTVVTTNRTYVGVQGEPGAQVRLFAGGRQVGEATLRPDGRMDFVNVEIAEGPQAIRVWMRNSWGTERWDSIAVHRSGRPETIELPAEAPLLRAGTQDTVAVRIRLLDRWGVPAGGVMVSAEATLAELLGTDADVSSVGMQYRSALDGTVTVPLRAGVDVGPGEMRFAVGDARARMALRVFPQTRPLIATGAGQVGVGAAPEAFGAVTVRGALDDETSVSVSYDSRRGDGDDFFGRGYDPQEEGRYVTLGDGSRRQVFSSSTQTLTARVERGFDRVELGDVTTPDFGGDERLGTYSRSLTGVSARVGTGPVLWQGFGSYTDQVLSQLQTRGDGTSGPYRFGGALRPGTDEVAVEVRDRDNAARILTRQVLARWTDYQIDYLTGDVLLTRPIPAADSEGNPVFLVARVERRGGGERRFVGGVRAEVDATKLAEMPGVDSLGFALMGVHDGAGEAGAGDASRNLLGGGVRLRSAGLEVGGQLLRSASPDSSAWAGQADAAYVFAGDRARLGAKWLRVGDGFSSSTDPRLSQGLLEYGVSGDVKVAEASRIGLTHEVQRFDGYGVERRNTLLTAQQDVAGMPLRAEGGVSRDAQGDATSTAALGKLTLGVSDRVDVWLEGARSLDEAETAQEMAATRPDQLGGGIGIRLFQSLRLEASHRVARTQEDSTFSLSAVNLRTVSPFGGEVWGGLERADAAQTSHSAVLGYSQKVAIPGGWALSGMFERRMGLSKAPLLDPLRSLPFAQAEQDRWSLGGEVQYLPADSTLRLAVRAETHDGDLSRGTRIDVSADAPIGRSLALLTRHDWMQERQETGRDRLETRRDRSLLGLAYRPALSDAFNLLGKVEWRRTASPMGGGLLGITADQRRFIGAVDAVWAPLERTEFAARYAMRWATVDGDTAILGPDELASTAQYIGFRADQGLNDSPLSFRLDSRLLLAGDADARWNLAPALAAELGGGLEVEVGYRFGELRDPDFALQGGEGWYATLGFRFTESVFQTAAAFWRERVARDF